MKKRVFALAAVLALIAALFTLSAFAADPNADYTEIGTADEFVTLMKSSANWSKNYRLTADIDLTGKGWNQTIGDLSTAFTGIFDGNGKTIKGLSLSINRACVGLFGTTRDAEIRNLTVEGTVKVTGKNFTGGMIGAVCGETLVEGCTSNVTVTGVSRVGGLIGALILNSSSGYPVDSKDYTVTIRNCTNKGSVSSTAASDSRVGGLIGAGSLGSSGRKRHFVVEDCRNEGTVEGSTRVGGIFGYADSMYAEQSITIRNCTNSAKITGTENVGGVLGGTQSFAQSFKIESCTNNAEIEGTKQRIGGIVGFIELKNRNGNPTITVSGCTNNGEINTSKSAGGIIGFLQPAANAGTDWAVEIKDCTNAGAINVTTTYGQAGGILGCANIATFTGKQLKVSDCINNGGVTSTNCGYYSWSGGIVGYATATGAASAEIVGCTNNAKISGAGDCLGGILGRWNKSGSLTVFNCTNNGEIVGSTTTARGQVGGIAGHLTSNAKIELSSLYNKGAVSSGLYVGGIAGYMALSGNTSELTELVNDGKVTVTGNYVGGIVGQGAAAAGKVTYSRLYNAGAVVGKTAVYIGSVAGAVNANSEMTECYYSVDVTVDDVDAVSPTRNVVEKKVAPKKSDSGVVLIPDCLVDVNGNVWAPLEIKAQVDGSYRCSAHTHTFDSNHVCETCGLMDPDACDHKGKKNDGEIVVEMTCVRVGKQQKICDACRAYYDLVDIPIDPNNHKLEWVVDETTGELVCKCVNQNENGETCPYVARTYTGSASEVYVSDEGFRAGGFSAESPINDYYKALELAQLAAQRDGKSTATVYVVGQVTVPMSAKGTFLEPAHADVEITVKGYGDGEAAFVFGDESSETRLEYGLNGDTVFDNLEIGGKTTGQLYFSARHNHLTMGQKISMDFRRNKSGDLHSGAVTVLGGCYSSNFGACSGKNAHLTLGSGTYRNVITGSANRSCGLANGKCTLEITGSILSREGIFAGSLGGNAGDIDLIIRGDASAAGYFSFGSSSGKTAKNVRVYLYEGSIFSRSFDAKQSQTAQVIAPIGCSSATNAINAGMTSLVIYYDPSSPSAVEMMNMIKTSANGGASVDFRVMSTACKVTGSEHTHAAGAEPVDSVDASCAAEGYKVYTCTACGENYTEIIEKLPHTWARNESLDKKATCKDAGMAAYACTVCNAVKYEVKDDELATGEHTLENGVCTVCNYSAAANCTHEFEYDPTNPDATETTACGTTTYEICSKCKLKKIRTSTGSHNWGKYSVTVEPTDTTPGTKTRKCKTCGKVETALLYPNDTTLATDPIAVDASGNAVDFSVESSKLTKAEKEALNALLQSTAYGSEVKVSYTTDGTTVTNVTYSIPVPDAYKDYDNVKVVVKDDDGVLHTVDFKIEKGYIVFTF